MRRPLSGLTALAPALVWSRSYVQGLGALTTCYPRWSGDSVAMAAHDEPVASGVPPPVGVTPPVGVALPATGVAPPAVGVAPPCGCVS
jgi:hypothetical protein